jgi:hypothetical protein
VRLYLDTNVYAHAAQAAQGPALTDWLRDCGHGVVLSDTLLAETIAIPDETLRMERLALWAELPSVIAGSLGELQAREFVNEIRRLRPDWRRLPIGDQSEIAGLRAARKQGWQLLRDDPERSLQATGDYRQVEERGIQGVQSGQRTIRADTLQNRKRVDEIMLGSARIPTRQLELDDENDFCRLESVLTWYQALFGRSETLSEYFAYVAPYVRLQSVPEAQFAAFWLDDVHPGRMPRGWATSLINFAQLRSKIEHGNSGDGRHAGHLLDAELMITEDKGFYDALQFVAPKTAGAAQPRLLDRGDPDLMSQLAAAVP